MTLASLASLGLSDRLCAPKAAPPLSPSIARAPEARSKPPVPGGWTLTASKKAQQGFRGVSSSHPPVGTMHDPNVRWLPIPRLPSGDEGPRVVR